MRNTDEANRATQRLAAKPKPSHGLDIRGMEAGAMPGMGYGRFGRMFPFSANPLPDSCLVAIARAMIKSDVSKPITELEPIDENPAIPAGYTYFGQFIDHDITLDPTPLKASAVDVAALEDFRTPALDLDCIYGRGPDDEPYMYEADELQLRLGNALTAGGALVGSERDLLRLAIAGETRQRAVIGDKRNDENRLVAQLHAIFIAFHNKVVRTRALIEAVGGVWDDQASRFRAAVNIVRWHYQWLVLHDYLARVLEPGMVQEVLNSGGAPIIPHYDKAEARYAYLPVEFSGAAYRFGHSMVRPGYALNANVLTEPAAGVADGRIPIFSRSSDPVRNLNGFGVAIPADWGIDWAFFLDRVPRAAGHDDFQLPQPSYRIDANLVEPLADLPEFFNDLSPFGNLAYRNLARAAGNLRLPSGEQVARAFGIVPLTPEILWTAGSHKLDPASLDDDGRAEIADTNAQRKVVSDTWVKGSGAAGTALCGNTPLWYYILREAEYYGVGHVAEGPTASFGGQHLGPVGSRIVAETFVGLLHRDPMSFLNRWPSFAPMAPIATDPARFTLGDLVGWTLAAAPADGGTGD